MPMTRSLERVSVICCEVMLRVSTRVLRYSTLAVRLLRKVMSMPTSGEKLSLMLTVEMSNMQLGTGLPVVTSCTKPKPFMYSR